MLERLVIHLLPRDLPPLAEREVHVFRADCDALPFDRASALLSDDERARGERLPAGPGRRFVQARAALRAVLGHHLDRDARTLVFAYGAQGKPSVAGVTLRFSVTHSRGHALFALAHGVELGVDLEREREVPDALDIAERMFAPREHAALAALPGPDRLPAFFRCWTRKEAYVKATGQGLTADLGAFEVAFAGADEPARFLTVDGRAEPDQPYRLSAVRLEPGWHAALCTSVPVRAVRLFDLADARTGVPTR